MDQHVVGHQLYKRLRSGYEVKVTVRQSFQSYEKYGLFAPENTFSGIDVTRLDRIAKILETFQPEWVINGIGIVKQRSEADDCMPSLDINALFPHRMAALCRSVGAGFFHFSTDCVFSGKRGLYKEGDPIDAEDLYGKTKFLGEVTDRNCLTLRTSMIGPELSRKLGLLEWFLGEKGTIKGFQKAIFSGFTTIELSRIVEMIITDPNRKNGLYHVSSKPISKYDLLMMIKEKLGRSVQIIPDTELKVDRSLDSTKFQKTFNYTPPTWEKMISELCADLEVLP